MGKEIERKYLVNKTAWERIEKPTPSTIKQGYITTDIHPTVRVRLKNNCGYLTIKGKNEGITRAEFEYEIPLSDAEDLLDQFAPGFIHKKRYEIRIANHTWEIDEFEGPLAPLILAEVELSSIDEHVELPEWIGQDVSEDERYFNSNLAKSTFR